MPRLHIAALLRTVVPGTISIAAGDSICQRLEGKQHWDAARTARMATTGFFLVTPMAHYMFAGLERAFPTTKLSHMMAKSGLNSLCTVFFIAGSFSGNAFLSNKGVGTLQRQLDERLVPTYMVGLQYWPLANMLLYQLSDAAWRGVGGVIAGTMWSIYLSSRLNARPAIAAHAEHEDREVEAQRRAAADMPPRKQVITIRGSSAAPARGSVVAVSSADMSGRQQSMTGR